MDDPKPLRRLVIYLSEKMGSGGFPPIPSANQVTRWNFAGQRWRIVNLKKCYSDAILVAKSELGVPWGKPTKKAKITIERFAGRLFDEDNFVSGSKYLIDSIVRTGILENDRPENLKLVYRQTRVPIGRLRKDEERPWRGVCVTVEEL